MTSFPILDLIAGMIFIYFLMSIICNAIFEGFSSIWKIRAKLLEEWIRTTLPKLAESFLDHSIINGLSKKGDATAYISGKNFSLVLLDAIAKKANAIPQSLDELSTMLDNAVKDNPDFIPDDLKRPLQLFIVEAKEASKIQGQLKTQFELYHDKVEKWFDSMMERVSGNYKRKASYFTLAIAFVSTLAMNIDSISIAKYLYANPESREKLAVVAYSAPNNNEYQSQVSLISRTDTTTRRIDSLQQVITHVTNTISQVDSNQKYLATFIPIGWNQQAEFSIFISQHKDLKPECWAWTLFYISKGFGLLITVFAICLGAPFWFDVLGKIANLRSSLKPLTNEEKKKTK